MIDGLDFDVVIPTIGRPSLGVLLRSLDRADGPPPGRIVIVDDRVQPVEPLALGIAPTSPLYDRIDIVASGGMGPATARNRGWRRTGAPWVAFLDDDVIVSSTWRRDLVSDLAACDARCAGSQGRVRVPLPTTRRPTDWERNVAGLQTAAYITADLAYRREALVASGGFDERFPRAFREDADLALRLLAAGRTIETGRREIEHPVGPADFWKSVRLQAGNADDALMRALHGPDWHERAAADRGTYREHVGTAIAAAAAVVSSVVFLLRIASFARRRIAAGPRDRDEVVRMIATSAVIPFAAVYHRARGRFALGRLLRRPPRRAAAVLFDRDGTLIVDDPVLDDPDAIRLMRGAEAALAQLRDAGIPYGLVTNQPRVGQGRLDEDRLAAIHARLDERVGPFDAIEACTHAPTDGCACRKPAPGLIFAAAEKLGISPAECVVVGDIQSDLDAARAAGARAVLVPTPQTLRAEVANARFVARDLADAVDLILGGSV